MVSRSAYHNAVSGIDLAQYGAGAADISVDRVKCQATGKAGDESIVKDKDVAQVSISIFMAGPRAMLLAITQE